MKAISQFVVHMFDLIEAEGRALRTVVRGESGRMHDSAGKFAMGLACLLIAVPLLVSGFWLSAAGLMWWLETQVSQPVAACLTGLALVAAGGSGALIGYRVLARRQHPRTEGVP